MDGPAELLEDDPHVDHSPAGAPVVLGDENPDRAEVGQAFPDGVRRASSVDEHVADVGLHRSLLGEEAPHGGPELFLLGRELEIHRAVSVVSRPVPDAAVRENLS